MPSWSRGSDTQNWQLDPLANWLSTTKNGTTETRTFDVTNALLSQQVGNQTTNLNYDLDGNLKNDSKFHYAFDAFQRIVEVKDQNQNLVAKYQMDTSNRRISKTVGTTVHRTVYAGWQVAEEHETTPSGKKFKTTTKVYVYGQYIDEPLVMQITKPNGNQKKFWYLRNQQYSIYALTNDNGKIVETYHYSAYGELEIKDADGSTLTESAYSNSYFYTGRLLDSETNLYYFRNRYYNANQGRFISRDPLGYVDGMSLYRGYFAVNGFDALGLEDLQSYTPSDDPPIPYQGLTDMPETAVGSLPTTTKRFNPSFYPKRNPSDPVLGGYDAMTGTRFVRNGDINTAIDVTTEQTNKNCWKATVRIKYSFYYSVEFVGSESGVSNKVSNFGSPSDPIGYDLYKHERGHYQIDRFFASWGNRRLREFIAHRCAKTEKAAKVKAHNFAFKSEIDFYSAMLGMASAAQERFDDQPPAHQSLDWELSLVGADPNPYYALSIEDELRTDCE